MSNAAFSAGGSIRAIALSPGAAFVRARDSPKRRDVAAAAGDRTEDPALRLTTNREAISGATIMAPVAAAAKGIRPTAKFAFPGPWRFAGGPPPATTTTGEKAIIASRRGGHSGRPYPNAPSRLLRLLSGNTDAA